MTGTYSDSIKARARDHVLASIKKALQATGQTLDPDDSYLKTTIKLMKLVRDHGDIVELQSIVKFEQTVNGIAVVHRYEGVLLKQVIDRSDLFR